MYERPKLEVVAVPLVEINPAPYNPRTIEDQNFQALQKSIETFDMVQPLVVNRRNMILISGHQRYKVLETHGEIHADVLFVDLDEKQEKALNITMNNPELQGEFDLGELASLLQELENLPEFEELALPQLKEELGIEELDDSYDPLADELPPSSSDIVIQAGDLIHLGEHRVLCGDCREKKNYGTILETKEINLVFTDPPYGVNYVSKNEFLKNNVTGNHGLSCPIPIENDDLSLEEISSLWREVFTYLAKNMSEKSSHYVCSPQGSELGVKLMQMMQESGLIPRHNLVWVKNNFVFGRCDYHYRHEVIVYGWPYTHIHYGKGRYNNSVWEFPKSQKNDLHPTMKPVALVEEAILNSSLKGMLVFDPFLGSGTTLIACESTGRVCYGMEISPQYCQTIIDRWCLYTGETKIQINEREIDWNEYKESALIQAS